MAGASLNAYAEHLQAQNTAVRAFLDILRRERDVLAARPVPLDRLSQLTEAKASQASAVDNLEQTRRAMAEAERATATELDDGDIAERFGCRDLWARLAASAAEARTQNEINGLAIQTRLDYTNRTLNFLRRSASQSLYAADGQRRSSTAGRLRGGA